MKRKWQTTKLQQQESTMGLSCGVLCFDIDNGMKSSLEMTSWLQLKLNGAQNIEYMKYGDDKNIGKQQHVAKASSLLRLK